MTTPQISNDPDGFDCYSDHATDINYYGMCTFCGSQDANVVGHVLPDTERLTGVDPVAAAQTVVKEMSHKIVDGVLLDLQTANVIVKVYEALATKENKVKLRKMSVTTAGLVCWKLVSK